MLIYREMLPLIHTLAKESPVISITGPRQSGKTTLAREAFPQFDYVSFENPDILQAFSDDPQTFLKHYHTHVIFDEAQRAPKLFSYLQQVVDEGKENGQFVLTGSQNFLLAKEIDQSLAGRVALLTLLPLSFYELINSKSYSATIDEWLYQGGYPRIYNSHTLPARYFENYISTYLERDVRLELGVRRLSAFHLFLQLCALRTGQELNVSSLASDAGITFNTAKEWLSILEASGIVYFLEPYYDNRNKSLTKRPKFYFLDCGLAAHLIGIRGADELVLSQYRGPLFESAVIAEVLKAGYEQGLRPQLSFWRDANKKEIDLVVRRGLRPVKAIEIKSSATYNQRYFDTLNKVSEQELNLSTTDQYVVYAGDQELHTRFGSLIPFEDLHERALAWLK